MRVVAAARARCRSGRRAAHRAPAVGGGCPLAAGASEGGGATGAPPSGCYASACPRGERVARQRASPFGALHTVRRRFPLILSLERGGRGLTRKPPQPRGYLHGTGGKNSRRGAAARLLFVGGNPPSVRDTARRSLLLLDDAVGLADGDGCPAAWRNVGGAWGSRAPARDYHIPLLTLSSYPFPLPTSSIPQPRVTK